MKTQVNFRSNMFPPYDDEEEGDEVNPGLWGKRLAEYLQKHLPSHGIQVSSIFAEDWGWIVKLENDEFPLWIGCGHQEEADDTFMCCIEPSKPFIRRWLLKKIDTTATVNRVAEALKKIFESSPDIRNVNWN